MAPKTRVVLLAGPVDRQAVHCGTPRSRKNDIMMALIEQKSTLVG